MEVETVANMGSESSNNSNSSLKKVSFFALFSAADNFDYFLMFFGALGACVHGAVLPIFFILFGGMIDSLGKLSSDPHNMSTHVAKYALYLVYLGLVTFVSSWIGVALWMQTGERQTARLRLQYVEAVLKKDINFFDTVAQNKNLVFHISSDAILVQDAIGDKIGHSLRYLSQFVVGFLLGFITVWKLSLVTLAIVPLIAVAGGFYTVILSTLSQKVEAAYSESGKIAEEVISQVRTVYSYVGESRAVERYTRSLEKVVKFGKRSGIAKGLGIGFTYALLLSSWAFLLWYASILIRHNETNGGKAFTTILNVIFSGFGLGQAAPSLAAVAKGRAAVGNIISMIKTNNDSSKRLDSGITLPKITGEIEFREVSFAYPSRTNMIFEGLSFYISSGKSFAVVGPSGSGKSTIISLVQRFYDPSSGSIFLDGNDLRNLQLKWFRQQMGLVNQEPVLFATTIAENIRYGREDAGIQQVVEAAKVANAHSFIQLLPDGYHTQVGEGGTQLSGGQKQRIAIARAMIRNPKILLLDEATSALDSESEILVQKALDEITSDRTTIVVAHRMSTVRHVDQIIVLNNGRVVESGTHAQLIEKEGEYATLIKLQGTEYEPDKTAKSYEKTSQISSFSAHSNNVPSFKGLRSYSTRDNQLCDDRSTDATNENHPKASLRELILLNAVELPYTILGSVGAALVGIQPPLFSFGISYMLTAFYSNDVPRIKHEVRLAAFVFLGIALITIPIYLLQHFFYSLMGERVTTRIRLMMFSAMLSNEIGWFDQEENSVGSLTSKLAADATFVRTTLVDRLSTIVQNTSLLAAAFILSFSLSWRISVVTLAMFPVLIAGSLAEQLFLKGFGGDYNSAYYKANALAREAISNIRTVTAFGIEEQISKQFSAHLDLPNKQAFLRGHISGFAYGILLLFTFSLYGLTLWYGSVLIKHGDGTFGDIIKSFMILIASAFSIAEALSLTPEIVKGSDALGSIFSILKRKTTIDSDDPKSTALTNVKGDIEFRNIYFSYPSRREIIVLNDLSLKVPTGRSLAVVGQSGSGKSTLIALVMRFYDPSSGTVLIDGVDIRSLNLKTLRQNIGLVQQEPALFSTTIYENIRYGNERATEIEIMKAAKAANAHGFISRLSDGYDTRVGEKGSQLSGGQKQRVAIARAILKNPSILLLDEATSALDTSSEKLVQEALDKLMHSRTTIIVAHRLSTIRGADSIAVMNQGKVCEMGSHEGLIRTYGSIYAQLVNLQQEKSQLMS
ncbi:ABC transporter B family member 13-like [Amaranthus tricolor]|uniref:ABC transporter B family member 13-like n=1 Tax=Amaranthus tricolor TaxID=29722 RepID=UPI0025876D2E|nr:ABC transporter B family member 13-like [Amaranthus tricolor]